MLAPPPPQTNAWPGAHAAIGPPAKAGAATVNAAVAAIFEKYPFRASGSGVPLTPIPSSG